MTLIAADLRDSNRTDDLGERPSAAARAFKKQALVSLAMPADSADAPEVPFGGGPATGVIDMDLVPVC